MENSLCEQDSHPHKQLEEDRLSNLENVLMQFIEVSQASFEANKNTIRNLEIQVGRLANQIVERSFMTIREEKSIEIKAHKESLIKEHDSRENGEEKEAKFEERTPKQGEKCLQFNILLHQLIVKEEGMKKWINF